MATPVSVNPNNQTATRGGDVSNIFDEDKTFFVGGQQSRTDATSFVNNPIFWVAIAATVLGFAWLMRRH